MYVSGRWDGFWYQEQYGRQSMVPFRLHFDNGEVTGRGRDVIGRFLFAGAYDVRTGEITLMKQYVGRHRVLYRGRPDGEGCIQGTWSIGDFWSGPFLLKPRLERPRGDEPVTEIGG